MSFLYERIPLDTSSLVERILSMLSRLEREKDCGSFLHLFQELRLTLQSFTDIMSSSLNYGQPLEDLLLELLFKSEATLQAVHSFVHFSDWARQAEEIIEKVSTEIALHQQDRKREEEDASARRRSLALPLPLRLRLFFSKGKYRSTLDGLRHGLNQKVSMVQHWCGQLPGKLPDFVEGLGSSQQARAGIPQCASARGMDSDLHKEVLTSLDNPSRVMTPTIPFDRPVVDVAETWLRDENLKAILMRLLSSDEDHIPRNNNKVPVPVPVVLPIVGVPGLGKTTLAWLLYSNNHQVSTHFRRRLWIDASQGFYLDAIAQAIEAIAVELGWWIPDPLEPQQENENSIITQSDAQQQHTFMKIVRRIVQHRCLIIVDGLKYDDRHTWLAFRESFKGTHSHIIITTRHRTAVSEDSAAPYILQGLPELYSWQYLLANELHSQSITWPKTLPRFIARAVHCSAGVPLALKILRRCMDEHPRYLNCEEITILRLSRSLADDMLRDFFLNLPAHLRNCFRYCSLFPPGHEMDKSTLIQLWMAQGFIPTQSDSDSEELGDVYFRELLERSLLCETQKDEFGNIRSCKMHKLMHNLCVLIAHGIKNTDWRHIDSADLIKFRHVSFWNFHIWQDGYGVGIGLRTLLLLDQEAFSYFSSPQPSSEQKLPQKLKRMDSLRVLDLHQVNIKRVPASINEMKLLRYLDLSGNPNLIMLPDSITRLIHLQALKLSHCKKLKELPKDIARLENLRHLEIVGCLGLTHMPPGIGQLTALRTLSMFVVGDESGTSPGVGELSELKPLNHLRGKLELRRLEKARSSSLASLDLEKKENLESVALVWETTDAEDADGSAGDDERTLEGLQLHQKLKGFSIYGYGGVKFPNWLSSLFNLVKITVKDCHSCQSLPPLHRLPHLKYLILESMDSLEYIISDISATALEGLHDNSAAEGSSNDAKFFPSLIHLCLKELPNLKGWLKVNDATSNIDQILAHPSPAIEDLHICMLSKKQLENLLLQFPLSSLMSLCISYVKDLDYLPETLSSYLGSIRNLELQYCPNLSCLPTFLVTLKSLLVVGCDGLTSLPRDIQRLQALETLKLKYCFKLDLQKSHSHVKPHNDINVKWWPQFDLARSNHGGNLQAQEELDSAYFAVLESLSYLEIKRLPKLVSLPDGICKLPSLQQLCLSCCDNMKYLPEGMQHIPNLYKIKINGCPLLKERCCNKMSGEWEKIRHIWDRDLDWDEGGDQMSAELAEDRRFFIGD